MILGMVILFITNDLFPIFSIYLHHLLYLKIFVSVIKKCTYIVLCSFELCGVAWSEINVKNVLYS